MYPTLKLLRGHLCIVCLFHHPRGFIPINRTSQEEEDSDPFLRSLTQRGDVFSEREEEEKDENDSQLDNKQGTQSDNDQDQLEEDEHTGPSFHTRHIEKRNRGIWRKKR